VKKLKIHRWIIVFIFVFLNNTCALPGNVITKEPIGQTEVVLVNKNYNRQSSRVLIRRITKPTRSNMDFAAYAENVMLYDSIDVVPKLLKEKTLKALHFNHILDSTTITNTLDDTPLLQSEKEAPMHWAGLKQYLLNWNFGKSYSFIEACDSISLEKWGDDDIYQSLQQVTHMYFHKNSVGKYDIWAMIEFKPWAKGIGFLGDENNDQFPELFAKLKDQCISDELLHRILSDYYQKFLNHEEIITWANELASFWYPTYNTDIAHDQINAYWPTNETEQDVVKELDGLTIKNPSVVIKGKPFGKPIYNVFLVDKIESDKMNTTIFPGQNEFHRTIVDEKVKKEKCQQCIHSIEGEVNRYGGGSFPIWSSYFQNMYKYIRDCWSAKPKEVNGIEGSEGVLFFRKSFDYITGGDIQNQKELKNPFPSILALNNRLKEKGVDFIFIPIPTKEEVYPEYIFKSMPENGGRFINPYGRKFIKELCEAGIEVIDLLPEFISVKDSLKKENKFLYQKQDTHWTTDGIELTARLISDRIQQYRWYASVPKKEYKIQESNFQQIGDIVSRLDKARQSNYKTQTLLARQIVGADGVFYEDEKYSPVLMMGDSFLGVYQRTGCKSAGVSAHVAYNVKFPIYVSMIYGGGADMIDRIKRMGSDGLKRTKLIIWVMTARNLYDYYNEWKIIDKLD
jgi:alginate O-acetyltransferase complex protein AlgJ